MEGICQSALQMHTRILAMHQNEVEDEVVGKGLSWGMTWRAHGAGPMLVTAQTALPQSFVSSSYSSALRSGHA